MTVVQPRVLRGRKDRGGSWRPSYVLGRSGSSGIWRTTTRTHCYGLASVLHHGHSARRINSPSSAPRSGIKQRVSVRPFMASNWAAVHSSAEGCHGVVDALTIAGAARPRSLDNEKEIGLCRRFRAISMPKTVLPFSVDARCRGIEILAVGLILDAPPCMR